MPRNWEASRIKMAETVEAGWPFMGYAYPHSVSMAGGSAGGRLTKIFGKVTVYDNGTFAIRGVRKGNDIPENLNHTVDVLGSLANWSVFAVDQDRDN